MAQRITDRGIGLMTINTATAIHDLEDLYHRLATKDVYGELLRHDGDLAHRDNIHTESLPLGLVARTVRKKEVRDNPDTEDTLLK